MKRLIYILAAVLMLSVSCSPKIVEKVVTETITQYRDSTVWRDTTVYVPIPLETDQAIVHVGDTSHRETSVASSDAWIGADGFLHHDLRNKPVRIPFALKVPERFIMSEARSTQEHAIIKTKEVKVEKKLSWWQKFRLVLFPVMLLGLLWAYRKELLSIIKNIIRFI